MVACSRTCQGLGTIINLYQNDFDAHLAQTCHHLASDFRSGDNRVNHGERSNRSQHHLVKFGVVGNHNALTCALDHGSLCSGLLEVELGQPMFDGDPSHTDKGFVDLETTQSLLCKVTYH